MAKLVLIAGHGAGDPGACAGGKQEATLVRQLAARIKALGGADVDVLDTSRNWYADKGILSLQVPKGSMVLELHMDSGPAGAKGAHVIIKNGFNADTFDNKLAANLAKIFPGRANILVGRSDLANVNRAAQRGINYRLAECGFISDAGDRSTMVSRMDDVARAILDAAGLKAKAQAGWVKDAKGWWYRLADGSYYKDCWQKVNGYWYLFGGDGYALKGWQKRGGEWYYLRTATDKPTKGPECAMVVGWAKVPERADGTGAEKWYWLRPEQGGPQGAMARGCWVDSGKYWVDGDGVWDGKQAK